MKAIVQHGFGSPADVLRLEDVETLRIGPAEVTVRVAAASVNAADWHIVTQAAVPYAPGGPGAWRPKSLVAGSDVPGWVEAVGAEVARLRPGDPVFGWARGSFAEVAQAREDRLLRMPSTLTPTLAAAMPLEGVTALQGLRLGGLRDGQRVLVTGVSGGVGTFAVQIAKAHGAHLTGVCRDRTSTWCGQSGSTR